jgi:sec-independent protein translocase protein TatA
MIVGLGSPEIAIVPVIALLIFGPSKLTGLGKGLGEGIRKFGLATRDAGSLHQDSRGKS